MGVEIYQEYRIVEKFCYVDGEIKDKYDLKVGSNIAFHHMHYCDSM